MNLLDIGAIVGLWLDASWWHTSISPFLTIRTLKEEHFVLWQIGFETTLFRKTLGEWTRDGMVINQILIMPDTTRVRIITNLGPRHNNLFLMATPFSIHT